jgi:hypothetical protein
MPPSSGSSTATVGTEKDIFYAALKAKLFLTSIGANLGRHVKMPRAKLPTIEMLTFTLPPSKCRL